MNKELRKHMYHNMFHDYFLEESWTETLFTGFVMLAGCGIVIAVFSALIK